MSIKLSSAAGISACVTAMATAAFAQSPPDAELKFVTECVAGERVYMLEEDGEQYAATILKAGRPGACLALVDERLLAGEMEGPFSWFVRPESPPQKPSYDMVEIGKKEKLNESEVEMLRSFAAKNPGDARIYASRFSISDADFSIMAKICYSGGPKTRLCRRVTEEFNAGAAATYRAVEQRNRIWEAEDRAAAAASAARGSGNSGYYQSGQYSRDVAASQGGRPTPSPRTTAAASPIVQTEREIREEQARCRNNAGTNC